MPIKKPFLNPTVSPYVVASHIISGIEYFPPVFNVIHISESRQSERYDKAPSPNPKSEVSPFYSSNSPSRYAL